MTIECGYNVHKDCKAAVKDSCSNSQESKVSVREIYNKSPTSFQRYKSSRNANSLNAIAASEQNKISLKDKISALIEEETKRTADMIHSMNTPLSLSILLRNNNRFTARQTPLIFMVNKTISIITWQDPRETCIVMAGYILLCLFPLFVYVLPHMIMLLVVYTSYYKYKKSGETILHGKEVMKDIMAVPTPEKEMTSAQWLLAMQFIQNTLGTASDGYVYITLYLYHYVMLMHICTYIYVMCVLCHGYVIGMIRDISLISI